MSDKSEGSNFFEVERLKIEIKNWIGAELENGTDGEALVEALYSQAVALLVTTRGKEAAAVVLNESAAFVLKEGGRGN